MTKTLILLVFYNSVKTKQMSVSDSYHQGSFEAVKRDEKKLSEEVD